jgi:hypothetical protein
MSAQKDTNSPVSNTFKIMAYGGTVVTLLMVVFVPEWFWLALPFALTGWVKVFNWI